MSTPIRNRRKKTFKKNEEMEQSSTRASDKPRDKQGEETYSLNIRRSSRKPKPRKHDDDDEEDVSTGQEITEKVSEIYADFDALNESNEPEPSGKSSGATRRETRKTYQHYLETLGYNADFSKISFSESVEQHVKGKIGSSQRNTDKQLKSEERTIAKQLSFSSNLSQKAVVAEENSPSTKVRTSLRTPKPKRTFALLEDDSATHIKDSDNILENVNSAIPESEITSSKIVEGKKASSENHSQGKKLTKGRRHMASSTTTPLPSSKQDVDQTEVLSDTEDQPRTSTRVRVPKRKFSLIEESLSTKRKRQKLMSPEHTSDVEVFVEKELPEKVPESDDENMQTQSSLVTKRSNGRKQKSGRRKGGLRGSSLDPDQEKGEHLSKKMDKLSSNSEPEKKPDGKREKQRMEKQPIVPKFKISKDTAVVNDSKKSKKNEDENDEEQTHDASNSRKRLKRKRGTHDLEKSASEKEEKEIKKNCDLEERVSEKEIKNEQNSKEHIVLKLTIPAHGSPKTKENEKGHEKHHHKHHHHKHKKESQNDTKKKKSDGRDHVPKSNKTSDKDFEVMPAATTVIKAKKKTKKKGSKEESPESLSSDNSTAPHVKLVIKKSPIKQKNEKDAIKNDPPKITKPSSQVSNEQNIQSDKPNSKLKSSAKEDKPISKNPKKKIKKDVGFKIVSAYSLFNKGRRKKLLEMEPDLDFASTSRRLAEMWKELSAEDKEYWRLKAQAIRKSNIEKQMAAQNGHKGKSLSRKGRQDSDSASRESDVSHSSGTDAVDMAAYLKLLGESLCSIGICLKRQDQMEVHGSLSVLLDTALCSIVPLFCLTSQLPEMAGCPQETQAQILDNLAYIIPGL